MNITVCKEFSFEAAHRLPEHEGHCKNIHGHSYKLLIGVQRAIDPSMIYENQEMVVDFGVLKKVVDLHIISYLDHSLLNDLHGIHNIPFPTHSPTAESIVIWIVKILQKVFKSYDMDLVFVRLYETEKSYAEWRK